MNNYLNYLKELRDLRKENIIFQNILLIQKIDAEFSEYLLKETDKKDKKMIFQKINELNKVYFDKEFKVNLSLKDILLMKIKDYIFKDFKNNYKVKIVKPSETEITLTIHGAVHLKLDNNLKTEISLAKKYIIIDNYDIVVCGGCENLHLFYKKDLSNAILSLIENEVYSYIGNALYIPSYLDNLKKEFISE